MDGQVVRLCSSLLSVAIKLFSEISWYLVADFGVATDTIVKNLDVLEDYLACLFAAFKAVVMQALCLERALYCPSAKGSGKSVAH